MGNLFSYYFNNQKYDDSLTVPLTKEDTQYASIIDIEHINLNVNVLENTTQNSLKNISLDITFLFKEIEAIKIKLEKINSTIITNNINPNNTILNNTTPNYTSIYVDANSDIEKDD